METFKRVVTNIDDIVKTFNTETEYIQYCQLIYGENEEYTEPEHLPVFPNSVQEGDDYIEEFCDGLLLEKP